MINSFPPTAISRSEWGTVDGKQVWLFCLENTRGTRIYCSNFGATVQSMFIADPRGILADILLGYEDLPGYINDLIYMGSVVGRFANRIAGEEVLIDDKRYRLATRPGGYHLHGGIEGFNKKVFDFEIIRGENACIKFSYTSKHMEEGFPGNLSLEVIYTLSEDDSWIVEYKASTSQTTIVNLTQHAYFNLSGNLAGTIEEHELKINAQQYLPVNRLQVPTGDFGEVANTPFDFTDFKKIGLDITKADEQLLLSGGYDHSFILEKKHTDSLKHAAVVHDPFSGRRMDVYSTEPAVHFYSGNFINDVNGKNNITYHNRSGFCLETQHFPDSPNHPHFPSTLLRPGEQFYSKTIFKFSLGDCN